MSKLSLIASIGVLEEYRKQGIGKALMNACINKSLEKNAEALALHATAMGETLYKSLHIKPAKRKMFRMY